MFRVDIGMDLGTSSIAIYMRDKGIVIRQPSVIAVERKTRKIIAVGAKAKRMTGRTLEGIDVISPIRRGVISDYTMAERMIRAFYKNALKRKKIWGRPNVCVTVPMGITEVQKRAVPRMNGVTFTNNGSRVSHFLFLPTKSLKTLVFCLFLYYNYT